MSPLDSASSVATTFLGSGAGETWLMALNFPENLTVRRSGAGAESKGLKHLLGDADVEDSQRAGTTRTLSQRH